MTWQIRDTLIYKNKEISLDEELLEPFFSQHPDKRPKSISRSTALWRGYMATLEILDNQLFIKEIEIEAFAVKNYHTISVLQECFGQTDKVKMSWFNGLIILYSDIVQGNSRIDSLNVYQTYEIIEIKNGNMTKVKTLNHIQFENFKKEQFEYFKLTEHYELLKAEFKDRFIQSEIEEKIKNPKQRHMDFDEKQFNSQVFDYILFYSKEIYAD
jgi:hypothetical protein